MLSALIPENGPPDLRGIRRFALANRTLAHRQGQFHAARTWNRLARKALRALRFAARLRAGTLRREPHCTHPLFSGETEDVRETLALLLTLNPDRRHAFREGRRRR